MKKLLVGFLLMLYFSDANGDGRLPVDDALYSNPLLVARGRRLMSALHFENGAVGQRLTSWSCPSSILVHGVAYGVHCKTENGSFQISRVEGGSNTTDNVVSGRVNFLANEFKARICACGIKTMNNVTVPESACDISLSLVGGTTNVWHLSDSEVSGGQNVLLYKNMFISFYGESNKVEIVKTLMNAGLTESERVPFL